MQRAGGRTRDRPAGFGGRCHPGGGGAAYPTPALQTPGQMAIAMGGQSQEARKGTTGTPRVLTVSGPQIRTAMKNAGYSGFAGTNAFVSYASGTIFTDGTNATTSDFNVYLYDGAVVGQDLLDTYLVGGTAASPNYLLNGPYATNNSTVTGNTLDNIPNSWGPNGRTFRDGILAMPVPPSIVRFNIGTTAIASVYNAATQAVFVQGLQLFVNLVRSLPSLSNVPIDISYLGRDNTAVDNGTQLIRDSDIYLSNTSSYIYSLAQRYELNYARTTRQIGSWTSGTNTITLTAAASGNFKLNYQVDAPIAGGITDGTYITAVSGSTLTLNQNVTTTVSGGNIYALDNVHDQPSIDGTNETGLTDDTTIGLYLEMQRFAVSVPRVFNTAVNQSGGYGFKVGPKLKALLAPNVGDTTFTVTYSNDLGANLVASQSLANTGYLFPYTVTEPSSGNVLSFTPTNVATSAGQLTMTPGGYPVRAGDQISMTGIYGAFNKRPMAALKNFIYDDYSVPMPLVPASPPNKPALAVTVPGTVAQRDTSLENTNSNAIFDIDATNLFSYPGFTPLLNRVPTPADGQLKSAYNFSLAGGSPSAGGTLDNPANYILFDGNTYFTLPANTPILAAMHQLPAGQPITLGFAFQPASVTTQQMLFGTSSALGDHGLWIGIATNGKLQITQDNGTTASTLSSNTILTAGADYLCWFTIDPSGSTAVESIYINSLTAAGVTGSTFANDATAASFALRLGARGSSSNKLASGTRFYGAYGLMGAVTSANLSPIVQLITNRHNRTYVPGMPPSGATAVHSSQFSSQFS